MNRLSENWRGYLLGLLVAFGLLATLYSVTTPLFEAPDEPWHYAYVRWLAEGHGLPRLDDDASGAKQEAAQPPLYYTVAALVTLPIDDQDLPDLFWHNPSFGYQAGGTVNDNKNMLIHTDRERMPWRGAVLAVRVARLISIAFGGLAVIATYGLAREAVPWQPTLAAISAGLVAFTPQFLFISGVVSNDSAAAALCASALWCLARIVRRGLTSRRAVVTGLVLGLAFLTKTSTLLLLPLALLAVYGLAGYRVRRWREPLLLFGIALLVGGWWYVRNWIVFDDPLGLGVHVDTPWGRTGPAGVSDLISQLPRVFRSFWGAFGWGHVELPAFLYLAFGGLIALAGLGWLCLLRRRSDRLGASPTKTEQLRRLIASATARIVLLSACWFLLLLLALLRWMIQVEAPHGRLLFPALGAWGLLMAVGWSALIDARIRMPSARYGLWIPIVGLLMVSLFIPFRVIRPALAAPRSISPQEAAARVVPRPLEFGHRARLLGYRVAPESVSAGGRVRVTLCWEGLRPMEQDYMLFIHLLGRENARVGERTTYPGQGRFPTSLWPVGRAFCDSYGVPVADWAAAPELYALEVGLYDAGTGERLPARDEIGQLVAPPTVGLVRVTPKEAPPPPMVAVRYDLGGQIALVGYDSLFEPAQGGSPKPGPGDTLVLTLYWKALQVPQGDYKVFVHLLDAQDALLVQDDAPPRQGSYPTWAWRTGDLVPDAHAVTLPESSPSGPYHWSAGMYHPDTRERLPVIGPEGPVVDGTILLEKIQE